MGLSKRLLVVLWTVVASGCSGGEPDASAPEPTTQSQELSAPWRSAQLELGAVGDRISDDALGSILLNGYVKPERYAELREGLTQLDYGLYRFPNGSFSNMYHWNGGDYYSAGSVWNEAKWSSSAKGFSSGFFVKINHRGTTRVHGLGNDPSLITDDDPSSYWESDPHISAAPRIYLDLPGEPVQVINLYWGGLAPTETPNIQLSHYDAPTGWPPPGEIPGSRWTTLSRRISVLGPNGVSIRLIGPTRLRFLRIELTPSLVGTSVRIANVEAFSTATQRDVVVHSKDATLQTQVHASPTSTVGTPLPDEGSWQRSWDFERFMAYLPPGAKPLICVNFGTGTPEEAAAWVDYANHVRGYGIKYWHVGNEVNGVWEEGGPISAKMYTEKFIAFYRAMKAVDPTIQVIGPVYAAQTLTELDSQDQESADMNWLEAFLRNIGTRERAEGRVYLDGVDLHQYPYFAQPGEQQTRKLLDASNEVLPRFAQVKSWVNQTLVNPADVSTHLSEYNTMPANIFSGTMGIENALATANIATAFLSVFPGKGHPYFFQPVPGPPSYTSSPLDFGDIALFAHEGSAVHSSLGLAPSSDYWTQYLLNRIWLRPNVVARYRAVTGGGADLRANAVDTSDSTRVVVLNLSPAPYSISFGPGGPSFGAGGVLYHWGAREFGRDGIDTLARASRNGGPSSNPIAVGATAIALQPYSANVIVARKSMPLPFRYARPEVTHLASVSPLPDRPALTVTGSVFVPQEVALTSLAISLDDGATFNTVRPTDGALDGPAEAFTIVNPSRPACADVRLRAAAGVLNPFVTKSLARFVDPTRLVSGKLVDDFHDGTTSLDRWWTWTYDPFNSNPPTLTVTQTVDGEQYHFAFSGLPTTGAAGFGTGFGGHLDTDPDIDGVRFAYKTEGTGARYYLSLKSTAQADDDNFGIELRSTNGTWVTASFALGDLHQSGWGAPAGVLTGATLLDVGFRIMGGPCANGAVNCPASGSLWIDSVETVGCP